jgi:hypothetical protein
LVEVQQLKTIFKAPDDDHIGRNMDSISDVKNNFTQVCM